ncbi:hypothetical protein KUTeg_009467 [Tegillarca granosa]|uniref:Uncharacterized protein n=1 Tax=Tegillarca granosa TaxID=220873 RepID=A0ABQ9F3Y3_TEGGR|nr:hypothetical protein KUTeg_009467 [Tegillarca granosa]
MNSAMAKCLRAMNSAMAKMAKSNEFCYGKMSKSNEFCYGKNRLYNNHQKKLESVSPQLSSLLHTHTHRMSSWKSYKLFNTTINGMTETNFPVFRFYVTHTEKKCFEGRVIYAVQSFRNSHMKIILFAKDTRTLREKFSIRFGLSLMFVESQITVKNNLNLRMTETGPSTESNNHKSQAIEEIEKRVTVQHRKSPGYFEVPYSRQILTKRKFINFELFLGKHDIMRKSCTQILS